ncbi:hypothetical protein STEG23_028308 [Scotinomys teguina]
MYTFRFIVPVILPAEFNFWVCPFRHSKGLDSSQFGWPKTTSKENHADLYNQNIQNSFSRQRSCIDYEPITTRDLLNWKMQCPPFSTDPKPLISLIELIFLIHHPTWDECQIILHTFFTKSERERILMDASKGLCGMDVLPTQRPDWNDRTQKVLAKQHTTEGGGPCEETSVLTARNWGTGNMNAPNRDGSIAINLTTLFLDSDPQETIQDCLKIQNVIQGSQLDLICQEPSLVGQVPAEDGSDLAMARKAGQGEEEEVAQSQEAKREDASPPWREEDVGVTDGDKEMTQWVTVPATKPEDLINPGDPHGGRRDQCPKIVLRFPHSNRSTCS